MWVIIVSTLCSVIRSNSFLKLLCRATATSRFLCSRGAARHRIGAGSASPPINTIATHDRSNIWIARTMGAPGGRQQEDLVVLGCDRYVSHRLFTSIPFSIKSCTTSPCQLYAAALKATLSYHTWAITFLLAVWKVVGSALDGCRMLETSGPCCARMGKRGACGPTVDVCDIA